MKKLLLAIFAVFVSFQMFARDFTFKSDGQTLTYTVIDEDAKTCMTKSGVDQVAGNEVDGELFIPAKANDGNADFSVIAIGDYSFYNQKDLYYIEFPEGLEEIGDHAFDGCETLTFEALPESLTTIGISAFANCASQKSIILPQQVNSLGFAAFSNMSALEQAVLFCDVDSVPGFLCYNCENLNTLYLPKGATVIGEKAFYGTTPLEEVILPEGLEKICDYAFSRTGAGSSRLKKINFPSSLKEIGSSAFDGQSLTSVKLNEGLETIGESAFYYVNLKELVIPTTLTSIPANAFYGNGVAKLSIPDWVTELAENSFNDGPSNSVVEVGNGVTALPNNCFSSPAVLKLGTSVKNIDTNAFTFYSLRVLEVNSKTPPTVSAAFPITAEQAEQITLLVPDGAKAAYQRNPRWNIFDIVEQSTADVTVHVSQAPIAEEARLQSGIAPSRIVRMKVTGTLAETDWRLIRENFASLISLDLSAITNTEIPSGALQNMPQLVDLVLPKNLVTIESVAFSGNTLMDIPSLPETLESIGYGAFENCNMLSISVLPDNLNSIQSSAFRGCTSLRSITAGENVKFEDEWLMHFTFQDCTGLEFVDLSNTKMEIVGSCTFGGCTNLTTVLLPETLTTLGGSVFSGTAIESIDIPASVTEIGSKAFMGTQLRTINIPQGVQKIDRSTFANCPKLLSVSFPASMTSIGADVFTGSTKVAGISSPAIEAPEAETDALSALNYKRCSLMVPQQSYRAYLNAPQWGRLASQLTNNIMVEISQNVDVTTVDEAEYQVMVSEQEWLEEAETPSEEEEPAAVRARKTARAANANGSNFARLFNGAQLASPTTEKGTRVFINPKEGSILKNVFYNDVDMTSQMEGNSLVLPGRATGSLRIVTADTVTGLDDAVIEGTEATTCNAYDTMGRLIYSGERARLESSVAPGIYIVRSGSKTEKVLVK